MFLLAAVLTASLNVDLNLSSLIQVAQQAEKRGSCSISTVGYRFHGTPGQDFRYAGTVYRIPEDGWVELIADGKRSKYTVSGETLPLTGLPRDQFGFRDVRLPSSTAAGAAGSR